MMNSDDIYKVMRKEVDNANSILKKHQQSLIGLFKVASSYTKINALVIERGMILSSKHTFANVLKTGRKIEKQ